MPTGGATSECFLIYSAQELSQFPNPIDRFGAISAASHINHCKENFGRKFARTFTPKVGRLLSDQRAIASREAQTTSRPTLALHSLS
jgi:hypothetical protein